MRDPRSPDPLRSTLGRALAVSAVGLAGLFPGRGGPFDPLALAAWLALAAPGLGVLAGARRSRAMLLLPPLFWLALLLAADQCAGGGGLPRPELAAVAVAGLYALGALAGALCSPPALSAAALVGLLAGLLAALPTGAGVLAEPWPPAVAARLLDLSPLGFVLESGGLDWMRTPQVYAGADAASIGPDLRTPWSASRAAPLLLFLAYAGVLAAWALRRPRDAQP